MYGCAPLFFMEQSALDRAGQHALQIVAQAGHCDDEQRQRANDERSRGHAVIGCAVAGVVVEDDQAEGLHLVAGGQHDGGPDGLDVAKVDVRDVGGLRQIIGRKSGGELLVQRLVVGDDVDRDGGLGVQLHVLLGGVIPAARQIKHIARFGKVK